MPNSSEPPAPYPERLEIAPVTLRGSIVTLAPLRVEDAAELAEIGLDPDLWRWIPAPVTNAAEMQAYVDSALAEARGGLALPFVIRDAQSGAAIGTTRYANIQARDLGLEIGWTWITAARQRSAVNSEAKYLLLSHAFDRLGAIRVELKTDALNQRSRRAIERLGAVQEGLFRRHRRVAHQQRFRDTVYYSIVRDDWPAVRERLLGLLAR